MLECLPSRDLGVIAKEQINPALPDKKRFMVRLSNGGQNWYLRQRVHGRYRDRSLKTSDLTEARRNASLSPSNANPLQALSVKKALLAFQESRQQLMDAPGDTQCIRPNTFKAYKARIQTLIAFFEQQQLKNRSHCVKSISTLCVADFALYKAWRERQGLMATTIKTELSEINTILAWLYQNEYIPSPIKLSLPRINTDKYRQPNRLLTETEERVLKETLAHLSRSGDSEKQKRWVLYSYWLQWLEDTFSRPHESRMLRFNDVREYFVDGKRAIQFYTRPETKTGERLVYATSSVYSNLIRLYESWGIVVKPQSPLFLLPTGQAPSASWFSDQWRKLIAACGFQLKSRELTQYSLRHQGINALLMQGVAPTKVADLAGHSLAIQQRIYKKYSLEEDHSVLLDKPSSTSSNRVITTASATDLPFPWEIDSESGEWFTDPTF